MNNEDTKYVFYQLYNEWGQLKIVGYSMNNQDIQQPTLGLSGNFEDKTLLDFPGPVKFGTDDLSNFFPQFQYDYSIPGYRTSESVYDWQQKVFWDVAIRGNVSNWSLNFKFIHTKTGSSDTYVKVQWYDMTAKEYISEDIFVQPMALREDTYFTSRCTTVATIDNCRPGGYGGIRGHGKGYQVFFSSNNPCDITINYVYRLSGPTTPVMKSITKNED